jgi:plasmid stabilization system protein ParE
VAAASRLLEQVDAAAKRAQASPQLFPRTAMGCRKVLVKRYPYSLIFQWRSGSITIVAVAHAKRLPSYWHGRATPGSLGSDLL